MKNYNSTVNINLDYYDLKSYNDKEISNVESNPIDITFDIDIEARSWGIKSMSLYGVQGPEEISLFVYTWNEDKSEDEETEVTIKLDWSIAEYEEENGSGMITVGDEITLNLAKDSAGNIICDGISVPIYSL